MDIAKVIADNLTDWMESTPTLDTFKKLSAKSGVGFGTVQRAKNGDGNITVEKLAAIAQAFGRAPADLLLPDTPAEQGQQLPPLGLAVAHSANAVYHVAEPRAHTPPKPQSPLMVAASRADNSPLVSDETKAALVKLLNSLTTPK